MAAQTKNFSTYTRTVREAIKKLDLAKTYADDGGHLDAAAHAVEAANLLFEASRQRNALLAQGAEAIKGVNVQ